MVAYSQKQLKRSEGAAVAEIPGRQHTSAEDKEENVGQLWSVFWSQLLFSRSENRTEGGAVIPRKWAKPEKKARESELGVR